MPENSGFTEDQMQYLEGFIAGLAKKRGIALPNGAAPPASDAAATASEPAPGNDPTVTHRLAQDRALAAGGTLVPEEVAKRAKSPFDMWDEMAANAAAGRDPQELINTRPLSRALYHHILNHRELFGLPRKFNIAFDGGGQIGVLEDTNDIGFAAVRVGPGKPVPAGVYFRMLLGGITGHGSFARDSGVLLEPGEVVAAAAAILRVFIDHGDRTDRKKARLNYLIAARGLDWLMKHAEQFLPAQWRPARAECCEPRGPIDRR